MRYRKACRAAISAKMTRGRSFSRWAPCPTALSCSTWADAWAQLRRSFALSTGALSEGTFMAYAIDNRRTGSAFLAVASTSVLLWFGTGLDPCWPLLWSAPLPLLHFATRSSWRSAAVAAASSWLLGSLNMWYYFHGLLHAPPAILAGIFAIPALMFALAVLLFRGLLRRGAWWSALLAFPATWVSFEYLVNLTSPHGTAG